MIDPEEKYIIKGCIKCDRDSQNLLYEKFSAKMFSVCLRYSRTREEAEDIFQEGFMKVYNKIADFKNEGSFEGWIRRIMVNTAIENFRKNGKLSVVVNMEDNFVTQEIGENENIIDEIERKELMEMIQKLPPSYRMVFNLFVFEGLKHREIAVKLGISEGTSKSNLSDARTLLQKVINSRKKMELKLTGNG